MTITKDNGLELILDLDGMIIDQEGGYWVKFEVSKIEMPTKERPHAIRYSLTLHAPDGSRLLGFDNAHAVKSSRGSFKRGNVEFDHKHRYQSDEGVPYEFIDAYQLLKDFWKAVDEMLIKHRKR